MPENADIPAGLHELNESIEKINEIIRISAVNVCKGIIHSAKIQSAQNLFERNTAIKEADDFLEQISES